MLYKKIKKILLSILLVVLVFAGVKGYIQSKMNIHSFKPNTQVEYKVDDTKFKIQSVLATNKLQSLEINFTVSKPFEVYDKAKIEYFASLKKALTTRYLTINSDYKAIFAFDLSKAQYTDNNDGTYTIILDANDIEINLVELTRDTKEKLSILGDSCGSQTTSELIQKLKEIAYEKVNTNENIEKAMQNSREDLLSLFGNVGVDLNKINIIIN